MREAEPNDKVENAPACTAGMTSPTPLTDDDGARVRIVVNRTAKPKPAAALNGRNTQEPKYGFGRCTIHDR